MDSYNTILERMVGDYRQYSGVTPNEESDIMLRLRVLAGEIYRLRVESDYIARQILPTTAEGSFLEAHAAERGLTRLSATKAGGSVTFYRAEDNTDLITIPAGTEVSTYNTGKRFVTLADAQMGSSESSVSVSVKAAQTGADYNVRSGMITVQVTPVAGIGRVNNNAAMTGGTDIESDAQLRERLLQSYRDIPNGTNAAYYKRLAMSVPGVYSAGVVGRARGNGTVNVYVCGDGSAVSAATLNQVQGLLSDMREAVTDVRAFHATHASVNLHIMLSAEEGYDFSDLSDTVRSNVESFIKSRGVGGDVMLCDVGEVIFHTDGVKSYRFIQTYGSDRIISDAQYPVAGTILITEV